MSAKSLRPLLEAKDPTTLLDQADAPAPTPARTEVLLQLALHYLNQLQTCFEQRGRAKFVSPVWSFVDKSKLDNRAVALWEGKPVIYFNTVAEGKLHALVFRAGPQGMVKAIEGAKVEALRVSREFPGLKAEVTGINAIVHEQRAGMAIDLIRAGALSLLLLCLLFGVVYRDLYRPLAAMLASLLGSVGLFALLAPPGTPAGLGLFLGGAIGLCFALRLACSYSEQRRNGHLPLTAWRVCMLGPGKGFLGCVATLGAAFLALLLTGFPAAGQVGVGGTLGLLGAFLGTLLLLPGFLGLRDPHGGLVLANERLRKLERRFRKKKHLAAVAAAVLLTVGAVSAITRGSTYLNPDLSRLMDPSLPATSAALNLESMGHSTLNIVSLVSDADQADALSKRLLRLPGVGRVETSTMLLPLEALRKEPIIRRIHAAVKGLTIAPARTSVGVDSMLDLEPVVAKFSQAIASMGKASPKAQRLAQAIGDKISHLRHELPDLGPGPIEDGLLAFEQGYTDDLRSLIKLMQLQTLKAPSPAILPNEVKMRTVSSSGKLVLKISPKTTGFDPVDAAQFSATVQSVDPDATGASVLLARIGEMAEHAYAAAGGFIWLVVLGVVIIRTGSVVRALLAMVAPTLAWFWTAGFLELCQVPLNLVTFLLPPILIGLGATLAVEGQLRKQARGGRPLLMGLLAVTVIAASLGVARNPALASMGLVLSVGLVSNWLAVSAMPRPKVARKKMIRRRSTGVRTSPRQPSSARTA